MNVGSSPHVRGTAKSDERTADRLRFIPARAGNRLTMTTNSLTGAVHPRTCGEQVPGVTITQVETGSSPHVRGTGVLSHHPSSVRRFIPARAGNRNTPRNTPATSSVHPRTCGEQDHHLESVRVASGSSPHVRGTDTLIHGITASLRFIPARAGNRHTLS